MHPLFTHFGAAPAPFRPGRLKLTVLSDTDSWCSTSPPRKCPPNYLHTFPKNRLRFTKAGAAPAFFEPPRGSRGPSPIDRRRCSLAAGRTGERSVLLPHYLHTFPKTGLRFTKAGAAPAFLNRRKGLGDHLRLTKAGAAPAFLNRRKVGSFTPLFTYFSEKRAPLHQGWCCTSVGEPAKGSRGPSPIDQSWCCTSFFERAKGRFFYPMIYILFRKTGSDSPKLVLHQLW